MEHWIYTLLQSSVTSYFRVRTMIWQSSFEDFMSYSSGIRSLGAEFSQPDL